MKNGIKPRICASITGLTPSECLREIEKLEMAEIRLDGMKIVKEDIGDIFSASSNLIATCRPGEMDDEERAEFLIEAIESGAAYVDIEVESRKLYREKIIEKARGRGCKVIISYHNFERTPSDEDLERIMELCVRLGGDVVKIACKSNSPSDNARLLGLLGKRKNLIIIGMGEIGRITRVVAPLLGAPFSYASLSDNLATAEGQLDLDHLRRLVEELR